MKDLNKETAIVQLQMAKGCIWMIVVTILVSFAAKGCTVSIDCLGCTTVPPNTTAITKTTNTPTPTDTTKTQVTSTSVKSASTTTISSYCDKLVINTTPSLPKPPQLDNTKIDDNDYVIAHLNRQITDQRQFIINYLSKVRKSVDEYNKTCNNL